MKIFIICSKRFYNRIPDILKVLESNGHTVTLPNSFDDPGMEERQKAAGKEEHANFVVEMFERSIKIIEKSDAVLVLNFQKDDVLNYIGGGTFLEMYDAFRHGKKIFLYNPAPQGILHDEINGLRPIVLNGDLSEIR
jgi:nucleoside 2-deoxyribosyltransferase